MTGRDERETDTVDARQLAPAWYYASLLQKEVASRNAMQVMAAFHAEMQRITWLTKEPITGEIRYQWWIDALSGEREGEAQGHPLMRSIATICSDLDLPTASLAPKPEAHIFELYDDAMEDAGMLEGWCGQVFGPLYHVPALAAGAAPDQTLSDASGHAAMLSGIAYVARHFPAIASRAYLHLPRSWLSQAAGRSRCAENDHAAINALAEQADHHARLVDKALNKLPKAARRVFLPLAIDQRTIAQVSQLASRDTRAPLEVKDFPQDLTHRHLALMWHLWRSRREARFG